MDRPLTVFRYEPFENKGGAPGTPSPSHALLARAAGEFTGLAPAQFSAPEKTARGKPFFPHCPALRFSISHSGALWLCAFSARGEVGLDVQRTRRTGREEQVARRFFHPLERAYIEKAGGDAFFRVWTAKEAYVKYLGDGIGGDFARFSVTDGTAMLSSVAGVRLLRFDPGPGYAACLCTAEPGSPVFLTLPRLSREQTVQE